jgi:hypothetical protein
MGFFLLLLYLVVSYLSPDQIYPELASYRIVLWIAVAAGLASIPVLLRAQWVAKLPQTYVLLGLLGAIMLSQLLHLRFGGTLEAVLNFLPVLVVFFLVCIHVNTWNRLRILVFVLSGVALILLGHALWDLHTGDLTSPYLLVMNPESNSPLIRIRAVGYLSDPNDFAQFLLIVIPLITLAWTKGKKLRNFFSVVVPCMLLIYGAYLTHSRGALLALTVISIIFLSRRVPLWVSIAAGILFFAGMKVFGFTGGRDVSAEAGSDRLDLWGAGLHMFRLSPLWGVGYGRFEDFAPMTAHNSFVLCLAEIGLIGYFCWLASLVISFLQLNSLAPFTNNVARRPGNTSPEVCENNASAANDELRAINHASHETRFARLQSREVDGKTFRGELTENTERVRRWAYELRFSLIAFVVTGWFLSRTYTITLYVLLGMTVVLLRLAKVGPREMLVWAKYVRMTVAAEVGTIVALYVVLRISWLFIH